MAESVQLHEAFTLTVGIVSALAMLVGMLVLILLRLILKQIDELRKSDKELNERVAEIAKAMMGFLPRAEAQSLADRIEAGIVSIRSEFSASLRRVEDKLDRKVDR